MCRTFHFWADLQVATHIIRRSQRHMLSVLDSALADARTLAHRIVYQYCAVDQSKGEYPDQASGSRGRVVPAGAAFEQGRIPSTLTKTAAD